ncbi:MAG: DUF5667 domain-containing protein [Dehalococcoidales bacterium]
MAKANEFENILNECLDRLIKGDTIESCLALYPRYATELKPLLKTAQETRMAAAVKPRPEFRQRAGIEFQEAIRALPPKKGWSGFKWQVRWVAPVAVLIVLIAGGGGTVAAATNALPDSPLYQVKLATESIQMALTFSDQGKTELYARFIDYRVEEIVRMAEAGKSDQVVQATERMNNQLLAMANLESNFVPQGEKADSFGLMMAGANPPDNSLNTPQTTEPTTTSGVIPPKAAQPPLTVTGIQSATDNRGANNPPQELTDIERLRQLLTSRYEQNLQILMDQLAKAPEALKPFLQKAIEVLEQGYQQAIANLG